MLNFSLLNFDLFAAFSGNTHTYTHEMRKNVWRRVMNNAWNSVWTKGRRKGEGRQAGSDYLSTNVCSCACASLNVLSHCRIFLSLTHTHNVCLYWTVTITQTRMRELDKYSVINTCRRVWACVCVCVCFALPNNLTMSAILHCALPLSFHAYAKNMAVLVTKTIASARSGALTYSINSLTLLLSSRALPTTLQLPSRVQPTAL